MSASKLDKVFSDSMQFHIDVQRRAQAMEIWFIVHCLALIYIIAFTDWLWVIPFFVAINAFVICWQRFRLEPAIKQVSKQDSHKDFIEQDEV